MVNRSPSSNFQFRHCHIRNMAPTPTGGKNPKGKPIKSKVPPGSATPIVRTKRKVNCSKCKKPHFPPTGRACQKPVTSHNPDLSSTLVDLLLLVNLLLTIEGHKLLPLFPQSGQIIMHWLHKHSL